MCIIGLSINESSRFPFVLWANRDELYQRPSTEIYYRPSEPRYIGGKDLERGGSWLGVHPHTGDIAVVTNIREGLTEKKSALSRGQLIDRFMENKMESFSISDREQFNGFNLIFGNIRTGLFHTSSRMRTNIAISDGIQGISNGDLNEPWPKTERLKSLMRQVDPKWSALEMIQTGFSVLGDTSEAPLKDLPDTGIDESLEKKLSPIRINIDQYGTVCSTIIFIDDTGTLHICEYRYTDHKCMYYASPFQL
ncbi:NRDE family protein [Salisediminibacterium beveridgei]|uniref:Transport and Golgi organisation 2 n=1 Tax=Salisediminibacterium beveridgei TaxID=632773 RepID=A0A1D7QV20_9BACI|nr:NRDE family protein [Salisediminibacterium beveridgei]AOM82862.1 hypothetical protein BBEV_1499 [Salisediminibacterium beveridgei]